MRLPLACALLCACGSPTPPSEPGGPTGPTYYQDVAPILSEACSGCHVAGGIGPFPLTTYAEAKPMAGAIMAATLSGSMPPWMPGGATPPLMHDRRLSAAQLATLKAWAEADAPEGDVATAAALVPPELIPFEAPDLTFDIGVDYVPDANLSDDYRCFAVPLPLPDARMATAFRVTPGNRKTVHHVIVSLFAATSQADLQALDDAAPGPGWQCFGGPVPSGSAAQPVGALGSWVPGVSAVQFRAGTANRVAANPIAVVQMHYNLKGGTDSDRTKVEVKFAAPADEAALQAISTVPLIRRQLQIPPSSMGHVETTSLAARTWTLNRFYPDGDAFIIGVGGHMHVKGTRIRVLQNDQTVLEIPKWDFHWQGGYQLVTPIRVTPTDLLTIECTYDNPGTTMITWGEGTEDEMCLAQVQVVDRMP